MSERAISDLQNRCPAALELAELVSLAARVEPSLLRRMRLRLLPGSDATAESELWFSSLVQSQNASGFVFAATARSALRLRLQEKRERMRAAREIILAMHAGAPRMLQIEEEITYLALSNGEPQRIAARLQEPLHTLLADEERRPGVAQWAARALPALPEFARTIEEAWLLATAANAHLGGPAILGGQPPPVNPEKMRAVLAGANQTWIGVRLLEDGIEFGEAGMAGAKSIAVPKVSPVVIEVEQPRGRELPSETNEQTAPDAEKERSFASESGNDWQLLERVSFALDRRHRISTLGRNMPPAQQPFAFLSYARQDGRAATWAVETLGSFGIPIQSVNEELLGNTVEDTMAKALKNCAVFVLLLSRNYLTSEWCMRQFRIAVERSHKLISGETFIVPLEIERVESEKLPQALARLQFVRFFPDEAKPKDAEMARRVVAAALESARAYRLTTSLGQVHLLRPILRAGALSPAAERLRDRLTAPGPKRILSIEGAGIRTTLVLGFLEQMEKQLGKGQSNPDWRLADYFDLIGGAGAGGLMAAGLACGMSVAELREAWIRLASNVFRRSVISVLLRSDESAGRSLDQALAELFGNRSLADDTLRTGLCVLAKRAETGSLLSLLNHPLSRSYAQRRTIMLREAVRAGMGNPMSLAAVKVSLGAGDVSAYVDASLSIAADPACHLLRIATSRRYPFRWRLRDNEVFLATVGAGSWNEEPQTENFSPLLFTAGLPSLLIKNGKQSSHRLLTAAANPRFGNAGWNWAQYDVRLDATGLAELGQSHVISKLGALRDPSNAQSIPELLEIGKAAARGMVVGDFPSAMGEEPSSAE